MKVKRAKFLHGEVHLPPDKSISHRAAMLASISEGVSKIENFSQSADCVSTLNCLKQLGVDIEIEGSSIIVRGVGKQSLRAGNGFLDCGNSGTTARLLSGILAGQNFESVLVGDESLSKRPMRRIIEPLEKMGARIESNEGCLPMKIYGRKPLDSISYKMKIASAQVKSCVLLAGLFAEGMTKVFEATTEDGKVIRTRDHTERMLDFFGAKIEKKQDSVSVSGDSILKARDFTVPRDVSAAAFFLVAAFCLDGSDIILRDVGINPTRRAIIDVLQLLGAKIQIEREREECNEPVADLHLVSDSERIDRPIVLKGEVIANLIDEIPIIAVLGTQTESLEVRDASELRVKESDRIALIVENLRRMGAEVEEFEDGFRVARSRLKGSRVRSGADHRIAMAFAIAGLMAEGETIIEDADCVAVSFPRFFETLEQVTVK
ncbi:MAG: 3-phosphoshikimate 1-carboxyvinyltransferase [Pyrinomonadaceae bacterium]|nr:3-phosphoshikimate 1-carboxyvinyltransferase [Pyrinomonadaceae bacterium]MCX7639544.1 3-phosphoshikimate 1-carboxyvinyltransferase [Pyrinomonadaceae bacterium]MDW8304405.1 3-phosphoshikimate 1-carboxyvinyltransferase [Acidobacteriota bacterium]